MFQRRFQLTLLVVALLVSVVSTHDSLGCCLGRVGDADGSGADEPTIGDITRLVDVLFINPDDPLTCLPEADVNQSGGLDPTKADITIGDISVLIDYLFVTGESLGLPECLSQSSEPSGYLVSRTGCKSFGGDLAAGLIGNDQDCIEYQYDGSGTLSLTHINAGFNCCPELTFDIDIDGNTITIIETEIEGLCDCNCLFDLEFVVVNLPPGEYRIIVDEPYVLPEEDPLDFTVDLVTQPSGMYCVDRTHYPWGVGGTSGYLTEYTGCKTFDGSTLSDPVPSNQSCIEYRYDGSGFLSFTHVNAGFNCCPTYLAIDVDVDGNTITITEIENLDDGGCYCLCLFDLEGEIVNLPPGLYHVVVVEQQPYVPPGDDPLEFTMDLTGETSGSFCVERTGYPWGAGGSSGYLADYTGCKSFGGSALSDPTSSNQDCIEYQYDGSGTLSFTHVNAGFNCCPDYLTAVFSFVGNTITVTEAENLNSGGCDCLCLFDLQYQIMNLPPGLYRMVVIEPYADPGDEPLDFMIDLTTETSGTYCVERTDYPWGLDPMSGELIDYTGCKSFGGSALSDPTPSNQDCLEYQYDGSGTLSLMHVNAGFNCCPDDLTAVFSFTDTTIAITEAENLESGGCHCLCLFDMQYQVTNLPPGQYRMVVIEPHAAPGDAPLEFMIDLTTQTSGSYCVDRTEYPWGQ